jgi:ATP-dependent RNA helicase RhlE
MTTFAALDLCAPLLSAIDKQGFTAPTDIQTTAIPSLMEGNDLMGAAQTGGGKTAAFLLPILHKLIEENERPEPGSPKVLILAPTRELAQQIGDTIRAFKQGTKLFYTVIYGGAPYNKQLFDLRRGVHIVVATPGRMHDHIQRGSLRMDKVTTFVLDECDRMLDMGFVDEVRKVAASMPKERQTIMFSATMNPGVKKLSASLLRDPVYVEVARENSVAEDIDHRVLRCKQGDKRKLLAHILEREDYTRALIFVRTKSMTETIAEELQEAGYKADSIHGDRKQNIRQKMLRNFTNGRINVLVATDVAARGLDVKDISHVINFDMPMEADAYIHRVGRTGRAGAKGKALSICSNTDVNLLRGVERLLSQKVEVDQDHPFHDESGSFSGKGSKKGKPGRKFSGKSFNRHEPSNGNSYNPNKKFAGQMPGEYKPEHKAEQPKADYKASEAESRKPGRKFRPERPANENIVKDYTAPKAKKRKGPRAFDEVFDVDPMAINSLKSKSAGSKTSDDKPFVKSDKPAKAKKTGKPFNEKGSSFNKAGKKDKAGKFDKAGKPGRKLGPRSFKGQKKKQAA